jgi:hypothetical protein
MEAGGALAWLRRNVDKNIDGAVARGRELWPRGRLVSEECDWSKYQGAQAAPRGGGGEEEGVGGYEAGGGGEKAEAEATAAATVEAVARAGATAAAEAEAEAEGVPPALLDSVPWDFIVGSDLVYNDTGVHMLPKVIRSLLEKAKANAKQTAKANNGRIGTGTGSCSGPAEVGRSTRADCLLVVYQCTRTRPSHPMTWRALFICPYPEAVCIYAHTKYRYETKDIDFFQALADTGRAVQVDSIKTRVESAYRSALESTI